MPTRALFGAVLVATLAAASPAAAQEMQVPLDVEGRVEVVDLATARRAGLWVTEFPGFKEARLLRSLDGELVVEITEEREGRVIRHRRGITEVEAGRLRELVSAALEGGTGAAGPAPDQQGRNLLIGQTTLAGLAYYGWALPYALGIDDAAGAGGLYLLTSAASFFVPFALTSGERVTMGAANLSRYGVTRGVVHGLMLGDLLAPPSEEAPSFCDPALGPCSGTGSDTDERLRVGLGMVVSVAEAIGGYAWASGENMTAGAAHSIALGGDVGLASGLLATVAVGLDDGGGFSDASALGLAGSALGIYAGHSLARRRAYTWGDAQVMYTGGLLGGWSGAAGVALAEASSEVTAAAAIAGGWTGLYITDRLVSATDFTTGEANLIGLSTFAGALAGAGLGVMLSEEDVTLVGSSIGGMAGFAVAYGSFTRRRGSSLAAARGPLSLRVDPRGAAALLSGGARGARPAGLFSASYRF